MDLFREHMTTMLEKTIGKVEMSSLTIKSPNPSKSQTIIFNTFSFQDNIPDMGKMYIGWKALVEKKYLQ